MYIHTYLVYMYNSAFPCQGKCISVKFIVVFTVRQWKLLCIMGIMQLNRYCHYHYYEHFSYVLCRLCYKILLFLKTMMMLMIYLMKVARYALVPSSDPPFFLCLFFILLKGRTNSAILWWRWVERRKFDEMM